MQCGESYKSNENNSDEFLANNFFFIFYVFRVKCKESFESTDFSIFYSHYRNKSLPLILIRNKIFFLVYNKLPILGPV